jgi:hypothetical protein
VGSRWVCGLGRLGRGEISRFRHEGVTHA